MMINVILAGFFACGVATDAERHDSAGMNAHVATADETSPGGVRVLFLGNSITLHGSLSEIGWTNHWGMAASSREKDYVHLVTRGIEARTGRKADLRVRNLADFERNYRTWDVKENLAEEVAFRPEYLIVALGENVPNLVTDVDRLAYRAAFEKLLGAFVYDRTQPNAAVRGVFWPNDGKDAEMCHAASDFSFPFVRCADLSMDDSMKATGLFSHRGIASHPGDKGMALIAERVLGALFPRASGYTATMDGNPVEVRPIRISAMPFNQWAADYQRPLDQTEIAGMVNVESDGATTWCVGVERSFSKAVVRPLSADVKPTSVGRSVSFVLPKPGWYVLELDGHHRPLEIFVNPKRDFSAEKRAANVVFGPGLHEPVVVKLKSHDRVYIDRMAVVKGSFQIDGAEDVVVSGYGIIDGGRNRRVGNNCYREGMDGAVRIVDSKNVRFEGPVVLDSACWCVAVFNSSDIDFSELKVTGAWRYNTDGIDICNSQRVNVRDCYVHSFDDAIVIKGNFPKPDCFDPVWDVRVSGCVCWCGWGRTLEIGLETWAPKFGNIRFENCDLIHNDSAALSVHLGGPAKVEDVVFKDIRIEYAASAQRGSHQTHRDQKAVCLTPFSGAWLSVTNDKMFGRSVKGLSHDAAHEPFGTVDGLRVEDISIFRENDAPPPVKIISPAAGSRFGRMDIVNVRGL